MGGIFVLQFLIGMHNTTVPLNCFTELQMALEKIENKSMIGAVRIAVSDKVLQFVSHRWGRNVWICKIKIQLSSSCSKKHSLSAREIMLYKFVGMCIGLFFFFFLKIIRNCLSHIHPNQWKINDMRTCWHVEVYSNSHFGSRSVALAAEEDLHSHLAYCAALKCRPAQLGHYRTKSNSQQ